MGPITLHNDPETVTLSDEEVLYHGECGERPIVVRARIDDLLMAEPQLDGEPIEWTVRLAQHIERVANHYLEQGREPEADGDGLILTLGRDELTQWWRPVGVL
jgi:hypothetical protein